MRFDVVVGNPPYQSDTTSGEGIRPLYVDCTYLAFRLSKRYTSFIIPARWLYGSSTLDAFRARMFSGDHIKRMVNYLEIDSVFDGVSISGGVLYFLHDKDYTGKCEYTEIFGDITETTTTKLSTNMTRFKIGQDILSKVQAHFERSISEYLLGMDAYGFQSNFTSGLTAPTGFSLYTSRGVMPITQDMIKCGLGHIDSYRVAISGVITSGGWKRDQDGKVHVLSPAKILNPKEVCTQSYICFGDFDTYEAARHFADYMDSKFVRLLLLLILPSRNIGTRHLDYIPLCDPSDPITLDFIASKYGLSAAERAFIEDTVF